jgi:chromate transporter
MCVQERAWIDTKEFEDAIATTNLLPGPASTQLTIYCAWRLRGAAGAVLGGLGFIVPGLVLMLTLSAAFLASHPPGWVLGAAVPAVALNAASGLIPASWKGIGTGRARQARWVLYAVLGAAAAATVGAYLALVLLALSVRSIGPCAATTAAPVTVS